MAFSKDSYGFRCSFFIYFGENHGKSHGKTLKNGYAAGAWQSQDLAEPRHHGHTELAEGHHGIGIQRQGVLRGLEPL